MKHSQGFSIIRDNHDLLQHRSGGIDRNIADVLYRYSKITCQVFKSNLVLQCPCSCQQVWGDRIDEVFDAISIFIHSCWKIPFSRQVIRQFPSLRVIQLTWKNNDFFQLSIKGLIGGKTCGCSNFDLSICNVGFDAITEINLFWSWWSIHKELFSSWFIPTWLQGTKNKMCRILRWFRGIKPCSQTPWSRSSAPVDAVSPRTPVFYKIDIIRWTWTRSRTSGQNPSKLSWGFWFKNCDHRDFFSISLIDSQIWMIWDVEVVSVPVKLQSPVCFIQDWIVGWVALNCIMAFTTQILPDTDGPSFLEGVIHLAIYVCSIQPENQSTDLWWSCQRVIARFNLIGRVPWRTRTG